MLLCLPFQRQWRQVVVFVNSNISAGFQRRHLAISCIKQPSLTNHPPYSRHHRQVEWIISFVSWEHITSQQMSRWFSSGSHQLQLRQVWTMVFAISILHHTILGCGVITIGGSAIQTHTSYLNFIYSHPRYLVDSIVSVQFPVGHR